MAGGAAEGAAEWTTEVAMGALGSAEGYSVGQIRTQIGQEDEPGLTEPCAVSARETDDASASPSVNAPPLTPSSAGTSRSCLGASTFGSAFVLILVLTVVFVALLDPSCNCACTPVFPTLLVPGPGVAATVLSLDPRSAVIWVLGVGVGRLE